ncbi:putative transcriptional regulator [Haloterrigena turkmenica DSM 5511]|uniref:Transcriptional regulator n=1 Tax=Haloterrigena turkmenica (strain ATCC 51198 / DSM 5511 / JCM 9101 / NCIMB 13204 / VKM B-1734 / 4k) TaxID=543526 RepID=D2RW85_HALTV|nr:helix-turn-helix domain-containing protein [Haloterrigena turkmenica]ADB59474.1 putative transcriptional regulator [Haloterrigena turkmenica DSM 5511]
MAIPTWTWGERTGAQTPAGPDGGEATGDRETAADLSRTADEFELLASPIRLEILSALADRETPLRYTDLRAATSIDDNGKLNYHLRRLEAVVSNRDEGYELTPRGRRLVERLP